MIGHWEIFLILLLVLLIFGGKKIPEVARGLGKGLREFKKAKDDVVETLDEALKEEDSKASKTPDKNTKDIK
jgi:sec-independent protein translocase protein TatA